MKELFQLGLAALSLAAFTPLAKAWTYVNEDALLIFRKTGGVTNVEFNLGNVGQYLAKPGGYIQVVTGWDTGLVNQAYGNVTNGVKFAIVATTSKDIVAKKAWLSDAESGTPANRTPSQWQNIWSKIDAVGKNPPVTVGTTHVVQASAQSAYDYINSSGGLTPGAIPTLGGSSSFVVEQAIPGGLTFWEIAPSTAAVEAGKFSLTADGLLYFSVGAVPAPTIITPPVGTNVNQGADVTFSVVATNDYVNGAAVPLSYQWQFNGTDIVGATGSSLTVTNAQADDVGAYTVIVSSVSEAGSATSTSAALIIIPDVAVPTVTITAPKANAKFKGTNGVNAVVLLGKATDNKVIKTVRYSLNGGAFQDATGTTNWSVTNPAFVPGLNTVTVKSIDLAGNESATASRSFTYTLFATLTVQTNGSGTVSPLLDGKNVQVGKAYKLTAKPAIGWLFTNWTSVVSGVTNSVTDVAKLAFFGQTNHTLIASFVTNRFLAAAGSYNGLFWDTVNGVSHESAGFITVKVTAPKGKPGKFSGKLQVDGNKVGFAGVFGLDGIGSKTIDRSAYGKSSLVVQLQLDLTSGDVLSGSITPVGNAWTAQLSADRAVFDALTNPATNYAGAYTLVLPGSTVDPANVPGGDGFGLVSIASKGSVKLVGNLGDGAKFNQTVPVSKAGEWPLYVPAYKVGNEYKGAILGWVTVSNAPAQNLGGTLSWLKNPVAGDTLNLYPAGFTRSVDIQASAYTNTLAPVIPLTLSGGTNLGLVTLSFGNLGSPLNQVVALSGVNKFTTVPIKPVPANKLKLSVKVATGKLTGSFVDVSNGNVKRTLTGVVLQNDNSGHGYFKGNSEFGSLLLEGQ